MDETTFKYPLGSVVNFKHFDDAVIFEHTMIHRYNEEPKFYYSVKHRYGSYSKVSEDQLSFPRTIGDML